MPRSEDLTGREFGKLKVTSLHSRKPRANWNCVCECGQEKVVWAWDLQSGATRSCGCLRKARKRLAKLCVVTFIATISLLEFSSDFLILRSIFEDETEWRTKPLPDLRELLKKGAEQ